MRTLSTKDTDTTTTNEDAPVGPNDTVLTPDNKLGADGLLTGEQIAAILQELGLNRTQAAAVFGGGPNAFAKYINGDVLQSVTMDRLLRLARRVGAPAIALLRDVGRPSPR